MSSLKLAVTMAVLLRTLLAGALPSSGLPAYASIIGLKL